MSKIKDLSGMKFSYWTVIELDEVKNGIAKWKCKCDCGQIKSIYGTNLTRGFSKSCGCQTSNLLKKANIDDIRGKKYGKLLVLNLIPNTIGDSCFDCLCDCGKRVIVKGRNLKNGNTRSCGCIKDNFEPPNKTHGMSRTRLFRIWVGMKQRCENKNNPKYSIYGGRGIKVCDEWQEFIPFMEWAYCNGYNEKLTIDRINPNGNYEPKNCRWSNLKEQANNTRSTVFLTYNGETKSASEWSEITKISSDTITRRKRSGWTDEECLTIPVETKKRV